MKFGGVDEPQLTVPKTSFGLASEICSAIGSEPYDGVLGLAFAPMSIKEVAPPIMNAINQGLLEKPLFTVWMKPQRKIGEISQGLVTYGEIDTTNCGDVIAFENLTSETYYEFKMTGIGVGNHTYRRDFEVVSDTGLPYIAGPGWVVEWMAIAARARYNPTRGSYMVECNRTHSTLCIEIGGNKYLIEPPNYITRLVGNICELAIFPWEDSSFHPDWILGNPFTRQYCNIYDIGNKRIGFAPSLSK